MSPTDFIRQTIVSMDGMGPPLQYRILSPKDSGDPFPASASRSISITYHASFVFVRIPSISNQSAFHHRDSKGIYIQC